VILPGIHSLQMIYDVCKISVTSLFVSFFRPLIGLPIFRDVNKASSVKSKAKARMTMMMKLPILACAEKLDA